MTPETPAPLAESSAQPLTTCAFHTLVDANGRIHSRFLGEGSPEEMRDLIEQARERDPEEHGWTNTTFTELGPQVTVLISTHQPGGSLEVNMYHTAPLPPMRGDTTNLNEIRSELARVYLGVTNTHTNDRGELYGTRPGEQGRERLPDYARHPGPQQEIVLALNEHQKRTLHLLNLRRTHPQHSAGHPDIDAGLALFDLAPHAR